MRLFSYCAYEDSKVGFQLGFLEFDFKDCNITKELSKIEENDIYELIDEEDEVKIKNDVFFLINSFFDISEICNVFGKFPLQNSYIYLLKNLKDRKDGKDFYLGIAFETDKKEDYLKIKKFFEEQNKNNKLFEVLSKIFDIDPSNNKLGIKIQKDELKGLVNKIINEKNKSTKQVEDKIYIYINNKKQKKQLIKNDSIQDFIKKTCINLLNKNNNEYKLDIDWDDKNKLYLICQKKKKDKPLVGNGRSNPHNANDLNKSNVLDGINKFKDKVGEKISEFSKNPEVKKFAENFTNLFRKGR